MELELTIERREGDKVILKDVNNKTIIWPDDKLPAGISVGDKIYFSLARERQLKPQNKNLAKDILNELLKTDG